MSFLQLGQQSGLYYEHHEPSDAAATFVFFNALTGDTTAWEGVICPILREAGYGTLTYNLRGQTDSPFSPDDELGEKQIVGVKGPELSVWRFLLGGLGLIVLALFFPNSRNLLEPFRKDGVRLIALSAMGVSIGYLLFHWSLDFATVPQVATMVTTIPIFVGLANLWLN